jgi:hypothetical protein
MYVLGVLAHPDNKGLPFPLILTGPRSSAPYFERLDAFVRTTLGPGSAKRYRIVIDDPVRVAQEMNRGLLVVKAAREKSGDSYYFNRRLHIPPVFQEHFAPTHESVSRIAVEPEGETHEFAAALRQLFSAVVWGNVKPAGVAAIDEHGPLKIRGEQRIMTAVDDLLRTFVEQGRMRLQGEYTPVYEIVS